MRIIDLHCYPNTKTWIDCQGPYVDALAKYWKDSGTELGVAAAIGYGTLFESEG